MKKLLVVSFLSLALVSNAHAAIAVLKTNCAPITQNGSLMVMRSPSYLSGHDKFCHFIGHGSYYTLTSNTRRSQCYSYGDSPHCFQHNKCLRDDFIWPQYDGSV